MDLITYPSMSAVTCGANVRTRIAGRWAPAAAPVVGFTGEKSAPIAAATALTRNRSPRGAPL